MPWCFPWPDYIKKKACRYLLQHYVGNFLEEKLTLDQLSVDLYSGTGTVKDVKLDVWVSDFEIKITIFSRVYTPCSHTPSESV